jgi:hypothetical protein
LAGDKDTKEKKILKSTSGAWVGYRPEIKVLDCTIRDGGLMGGEKGIGLLNAQVKYLARVCMEKLAVCSVHSIDYVTV